MAERHSGAVLSGEGNRLQGIFTERDLLIRVIARGLDPDATQLKEVMTPDPDTVGPNDWASLALERMRSSGYRHVPVRSEEHTSELQSLMRISYAVFFLTTQNNM